LFVPNLSTTSIGNMPRRLSWLRGPGVVQLDVSLFRHFKITKDSMIGLRGEALNVSDSTHYSDVSTSCSVIGASWLRSFGEMRCAYGQRIAQLYAVLIEARRCHKTISI